MHEATLRVRVLSAVARSGVTLRRTYPPITGIRSGTGSRGCLYPASIMRAYPANAACAGGRARSREHQLARLEAERTTVSYYIQTKA